MALRPRREAPEELREVYRDHVDAVYAFFGYAVGRDTAEDLTASTFERVLRAWRTYDAERAGVRTWVLAIARNQLTDHYRRQRLRRMRSTDEEPELLARLVEPNSAFDDLAQRDAVARLLTGLPERDREVLALRYGADLSANEVAELLDLTSANVHQIASRALRRLRATLSEEGVSDSA